MEEQTSSNEVTRESPQNCRKRVYDGKPWSRPRCVLIVPKSVLPNIFSVIDFVNRCGRLTGSIIIPRNIGSIPPYELYH